MSIVGNYCYCSDGKWYGEAVWTDLEQTWFIVLDDDDPPELVVALGADAPKLPWFKITTTGPVQTGVRRIFDGKSLFKPAINFFGELVDVPPPPQRYHSVSDEMPMNQGIYFDARRGK